jgi:DNA polymerase I-like protein with 3'-5' exonuclease and polymerase domains/uracil-DNA glycosylase
MKKPPLCKNCPAYHDPCLEHGGGDNPAHLIVVGATPSGFSIGQDQAFFGRDGRLFKKLLDRVRKRKKYADIKIYYTYSALVGGYKPTAKHVQHCQRNIMREIDSVQGINGNEPVIVPLGPMALKAVGVFARKITDVVGRVMMASVPSKQLTGTRKLSVVPLLSMEHVNTRPGTTNVVQAALLKAVKLAYADEEDAEDLDEVTSDYVFPQTADEVEELVEHVIGYYDEELKTGPDHHVIAVDTETNTLHPYSHENPQTLMLSVAWDDRKAATILLDHPKAPYEGNDLKRVWRAIARLLRCPKPKVFHNWKFDQKFLEVVNGIPVNRVAWDTMLGEHYLDEDKKGLYSLKQLTPIYASSYQGYDDELQELFRGEKERGVIRLANNDIMGLLTPEMTFGPNHEELLPDGQDLETWLALARAIAEKEEIKKTPAKKRPTAQRERFKELGEFITKLRNAIGIKKPGKKHPKSWGSSDVAAGYERIPIETILKYAAVDADVTRIVFVAQAYRLRRTNHWEEGLGVMKHLYLPGSRVLSAMEYRGFKIDQLHLAELWDDVTDRMEGAEKEICDRFGSGMNLNHAKQVADKMAKLKFEPLPGVEQGGTGKDVLEKYMEHYPDDDPRNIFADKVLEYRECHKTLQSFLKPIKEFSEADGKVHCTFHLNGTATGRLSSASPNMQNIPKITARRVKDNPDGTKTVVHPGFNIKKLFIPSKPGNVIVNVDIKGAELRVYTAYSQDKHMIRALSEGLDVHSFVTSLVYKIPYETVMELKEKGDPDIDKKRLKCKRTVFGTFYGAGPYKIAEQIQSTREEAKEIQVRLFTEFPALPEYIEKVTDEVRRKQQVQTLFGRIRRFRLAHASDRHFQDAKREAVNFLIQSTSSDLVLSQLCEVNDHLDEVDGEMLITVHDSMVFELPKENVQKLFPLMDRWIVDRVKEKYDWLPVPFEYDIEAGPSYGEVKEVHREAS